MLATETAEEREHRQKKVRRTTRHISVYSISVC